MRNRSSLLHTNGHGHYLGPQRMSRRRAHHKEQRESCVIRISEQLPSIASPAAVAVVTTTTKPIVRITIATTATASTATATTATTIAICSNGESTFYRESELFLTATTPTPTKHSHLLKRWGNIGFSLLENCNEVTGRLRVLCREVSI